MQAWPTPPAAAWMRTVSPFWILAVSYNAAYAVAYTTGRDEADIHERSSGILVRAVSCVLAKVPIVPWAMPQTRSPTLKLELGPVRVTTPLPSAPKSVPMTWPRETMMSRKLRPHALTWNSTSPSSRGTSYIGSSSNWRVSRRPGDPTHNFSALLGFPPNLANWATGWVILLEMAVFM